MIVGGYSLHLYCDGKHHKALHPEEHDSGVAEFDAETYAQCARMARKKGWLIRTGKAFCEVCRDYAKAHNENLT